MVYSIHSTKKSRLSAMKYLASINPKKYKLTISRRPFDISLGIWVTYWEITFNEGNVFNFRYNEDFFR